MKRILYMYIYIHFRRCELLAPSLWFPDLNFMNKHVTVIWTVIIE